ncbi:hypothetical protein [Parvularcula marina]|uniref:hypothetical protein n=1 Tax=Parvularcula marina TaxID=2292771 RepID=UPI003519335D
MTATDFTIDDTSDSEGAKSSPRVVERYRAQELTTGYRLQMLFGRVADRVVSAAGVALLFLPFLIGGLLLADIPAKLFDGWTSVESLKPSQWLSRGDLFFTAGIFLLVLLTRRHGGRVAHQALALAWTAAIILTLLMLIYLAPTLQQSDFPNGRYMLGLVSGWYAGAHVAVAIYDLTRGSRWWRPPFLALAGGLGVQSMIYFFVVYAATGAPWVYWMGTNFMLQLVMSVVFVGLYRTLRHSFRPRSGRVSGYGGR